GVRSDVAVKIHGDDLEVLREKADEVVRILSQVQGAADLRAEQVTGLPVLEIALDRDRLARFGVNLADAQEVISTAIGGRVAGELFEGDRRFPIVVRLPEEIRSDIDALGSLPVPLPSN